MERAGYWFKEIVLPDPAPPPSAAAPSDVEPERTEADIDAEAELYVVMYRDRAERIRAAGGLPAHLDFGAPGPEIVAQAPPPHRPFARRHPASVTIASHVTRQIFRVRTHLRQDRCSAITSPQ